MADVLRLGIDVAAKGAQKEIKQTAGAVAGLGGALKVAAGLGIGFGSGMAVAQGAIRGLESAARAVPRAMMEALEATADYGDSIAKMSRATTVAAESLQVLHYAAERGGSTAAAMDTALKRLSRSMSDANQGSKTAADAFARFGVALTDNAGNLRSTEAVFRDLADAMKRQGLTAQTNADIQAVLGRSASDLNNVLIGGAAGIDQYGQRLSDLGGIMGTEALTASEVYKDATLDLGVAVDGLQRQLGTQLLPAAIGVAMGLTELAKSTDLVGFSIRGVVLDSGDLIGVLLRLSQILPGPLGAALGIGTAGLVGYAGAAERGQMAIEDATLQAEKDSAARMRSLQGILDEAQGRSSIAKAADEQAEAVDHVASAQERLAAQVRFLGLDDAAAAALRFADNLDLLSQALDADLITADQYHERIALLRTEMEGAGESARDMADDTVIAWEQMGDAAGGYADTLGTVSNVLGSLGQFAQVVGDIVVAQHGRGSEAAKAAARTTFAVTQAARLAEAIVSTAAAVISALANPPGPPYSTPQAVAAGVLGGVEIATIAATTVAGLADAGLTPEMVNRATRGGYSTVMLQSGEAVIDRQGTGEISRMLAMQRSQMERSSVGQAQSRGGGAQAIYLDGARVGEVMGDRYVREQERGVYYSDRRRY